MALTIDEINKRIEERRKASGIPQRPQFRPAVVMASSPLRNNLNDLERAFDTKRPIAPYQVTGTVTGRSVATKPNIKVITPVQNQAATQNLRKMETLKTNAETFVMKVLVACKVTDPHSATKRKNDFCHAKIGELVIVPLKLAVGEYADDDTGNARSFIGIDTGNRTTTARVINSGVNVSAFERLVENYLTRTQPDLQINYRKQAKEIAKQALRVASEYDIGSVIEYRDGRSAER